MNKKQKAFGVIVGLAALAGMFNIVEYPNWIQIPFVTIILGVWLFEAAIHAKQMYERGAIDSFLVYVNAPLVLVFIIIDVFFNITFATIIYRERPKEWLFTTRTQRHIDESTGRQLKAAQRWGRRLNYVDPGHIERI